MNPLIASSSVIKPGLSAQNKCKTQSEGIDENEHVCKVSLPTLPRREERIYMESEIIKKSFIELRKGHWNPKNSNRKTFASITVVQFPPVPNESLMSTLPEFGTAVCLVKVALTYLIMAVCWI